MLKFIVSVCDPVRLFPRMRVDESINPAFAPPNATVVLSAVSGPALLEIWKSAEGMLLPAPSVNAAAELAKNAYTFTLFTLGFSNQRVVAVIAVLPALLPLPGVIVKLTALAESVTLIESVRTACSVIALAPEFFTCAAAGLTARLRLTPSIIASTSLSFRFIAISCLSVLKTGTAQGREPPHPPSGWLSSR